MLNWSAYSLSSAIGQPLTATVIGDEGDDEIYGSRSSSSSYTDVLLGWGGDDTIRGGQGDDIIEGGDGADALYGEQGDDEIWGDSGYSTSTCYDAS